WLFSTCDRGIYLQIVKILTAGRIRCKRNLIGFAVFGSGIHIRNRNAVFFYCQKLDKHCVDKRIPFCSYNKWYQETFGAPLGHQPEDSNDPDGLALPVDGTISESFQANGYGVMIAADEPTEVTALEDGVVTFAGTDRKTNKTVVIQHADNS